MIVPGEMCQLVYRELWIPVPGDMPGEMFARVTASPGCEEKEIYAARVFANDVVRVPVLLPATLGEVGIEFTAINSCDATLTTRKQAFPV